MGAEVYPDEVHQYANVMTRRITEFWSDLKEDFDRIDKQIEEEVKASRFEEERSRH